jgi:hypothetical protein
MKNKEGKEGRERVREGRKKERVAKSTDVSLRVGRKVD